MEVSPLMTPLVLLWCHATGGRGERGEGRGKRVVRGEEEMEGGGKGGKEGREVGSKKRKEERNGGEEKE